jgi:hypothetical protein
LVNLDKIEGNTWLWVGFALAGHFWSEEMVKPLLVI